MAKIFITFHPNDQRAVEQIVAELEQYQHNVWYDKNQDTSAANIAKQIKKSDVFIYVLSPQAATFPPARLQLREAQQNGLRIIPVVMHPQTPVLPELTNVPIVNMMGGVSRSGLDQLVQMTGVGRGGRKATPSQAIASPPIATSRRTTPITALVEFLMIAVLVLSVVLGAFLILEDDTVGPEIGFIDAITLEPPTTALPTEVPTEAPTEAVTEVPPDVATANPTATPTTEGAVGGETQMPATANPTATPTIEAVSATATRTPSATADLNDPVQQAIATATSLAATAEAIRLGTIPASGSNFSAEPTEAAADVPTATFTPPPPTPTPTITPSPTPSVAPVDMDAQLRLHYSPEGLTVQNLTSERASFRGFELVSADGDVFDTSALFPSDIEPNGCASIGIRSTLAVPTGCATNETHVVANTTVENAVWVWDETRFTGLFTIRFNGYDLTTCSIAAGVCAVDVPYARLGMRLPPNGWLAYASEKNGNADIFVTVVGLSAIGGGEDPTQLTDDPANERYPDFHPNGRLMAFASDQGGDWGIYTLDLDTGEVSTLFDLSGSDQIEPRYSPDGNSIVFLSDHVANNFDVYTLRIGDDDPIRISLNTVENTSASWAPEGDFVVYSEAQPAGDGDLHASPALGGIAIRITSTPDEHQDPWVTALSGGSRTIYFISDRVTGQQVIWTGTLNAQWQINTSSLRAITSGGTDSDIAPDPSGSLIAYVHTEGNRTSLRVVRITTGTTSILQEDAFDPAWYPVIP